MMNPLRSWLFFICLLGFATLFISITGKNLPENLASHFAGSGMANGYMSKSDYISFMMGISVGLPLVIVAIQTLLLHKASMFINLPNRDYWLAPARRESTLGFLVSHTVWFGCVLVVFLCFVHHLVVSANAVDPPVLPSSTFISGLIAFVTSILLWLGVLIVRFRRIP